MQDQDKQTIAANVTLAKEGISDGFEFLWEYFAPRVKSYIICRINQKSDADDLLRDIFIRVFNKIDTFNEEKASFSTWLFTITKNVLIDYFASFNHKIQWLDESGMLEMERYGQTHSIWDQFQSTVEELENKSEDQSILLDKIELVLDQLPKQYAEIIRLKFFFNMDNKEIAQTQSKTPGNVRVALHRALALAAKLVKKMNI